MQRFEYAITKHEAERFKHVVYFCSEAGECGLDEVPGDQIKMLATLLNEHGQAGWELIQVSFGKGGILAFWKREIHS
jgi:hypothetical protein